ncbi:polymorphic toxin type 24 domain-containing protein [Flindersiella endophytica]
MAKGLKGAGGFLKKMLGDLIRPVRRRRPGRAAPTPPRTPTPTPSPPRPNTPLGPNNLKPNDLGPNATQHVGTGKGRAKNKFPNENGPANGTLYRLDENGNVRHYATYDANGRITSRVDMQGAAHGGVPTPHTLRYTHNTGPDGRVHVQSNKTVDPWDASTDI